MDTSERAHNIETNTAGVFIVIEGTDGSGKTTQYELLKKRLVDEGHDVETIHFPRYEEPSSYFVREYLAGNYGSANEVGPYTASLFYALDRYQAAIKIREYLAAGKVVLCDRFTGANMAHQGTKFQNAEERRGYFIWLDNLEFEMLRIPRPDLTLVLNTPLDVVLDRLHSKKESSIAVKKDIHEVDPEHIRKSLAVYLDLCELFPKDFLRVDCARNNELLGITAVGKLVYEKVAPLLPKPDRLKKVAAHNVAKPTRIVDNPYVRKNNAGVYEITKEGYDWLKEAVTDPTGDVYATFGRLESLTAAAAMARLSRRGDDMRVTILDEFADKVGKDDKLLQRVITAYGDDSVQQLVGQHIVVENASNLLTKKLEWGRLAAYLEQSTRYIYFDQKDAKGKYKYFVPEHFDDTTKKTYVQHMDDIFIRYTKLVRALTAHIREKSSIPKEEQDRAWRSATKAQACDAARPLLPVATKATVGIFASGQALESLIMHLLSDELPEARRNGQKLLEQARKVIPTFLERADKPERGGAMIAYRANTYKAVHDLAEAYLPENHSEGEQKDITLVDVWPRNELSIVPDMLYEHSNLPLKDLQAITESWSYKKKLDVFTTYIGERLNRRQRPGRALEKVHYSWDIVCDYGIFRDLQRHRIVDDLAWQPLTPRFGFEVPELIEEAGLTDLFEECFDISLRLYSVLQQAGYALEAQYATLLGHKMRWKVTMNAREAFHFNELRTSPQGHPGYRKLVLKMHEKMSEIHPLLTDAMKFVNSDEDPELTRLAGEKYTQFKLSQLDTKNEA